MALVRTAAEWHGPRDDDEQKKAGSAGKCSVRYGANTFEETKKMQDPRFTCHCHCHANVFETDRRRRPANCDDADKVGRQRAAGGVPAEATAVAAGATPREGEQRMRLGGSPGGDGSHLAAEHAGEASELRDLHLLDLLTHGRTVARTVLACDPDLLGVLAHLGAGFLTAKRVAARRRREAAEPSDEPAGPTIQGQLRCSRENFTCP